MEEVIWCFDEKLPKEKRGERIFVTGSPITEVLYRYIDKIEQSDVLDRIGLK